MKRIKRGRPPKFQIGDITRVKATKQAVVIVDYQQRPNGDGRYRVVNLTRVEQGKTVGRARYYRPWELHKPLSTRNVEGPKIYRANERLSTHTNRGCNCMCCEHIAPKSRWPVRKTMYGKPVVPEPEFPEKQRRDRE